MKTPRHPYNLIWLLLLVWLSVALPSYAFSFENVTDALTNTHQDTLRVYTENDDVALEEQKNSQEETEEADLRTVSLAKPLCLMADRLLIAFAIFAGFVPLRIFRYIRRRTRTPSCSPSTAYLLIN